MCVPRACHKDDPGGSQCSPGLQNKWGWSVPIGKSGWPGSPPIPDDKGLRDGRWSGGDPAAGGRDAVGEEGQGVVSGRWQNRELGAECATNNPASWLVAWRCETTHRARPGGEHSCLVTISAKAISRRTM